MPKRVIAALACGLVLFVAGLRAIDLREERERVIAAAEARADNLALLLASYITESFHAADAALRQLQIQSERIGGPAAADSLWLPSLNSAKAGLTGVGAITVVDAAGIIRHSTRPEIVGQSRRTEYLTRRIADTRSDELIVGTPFPTIAPPGGEAQMIIPIGRRLASNGVTDGSIAASFRPEAPRSLLRQINASSGGVITVLHPEGVVLFEEPARNGASGRVATDDARYAAAAAGQRSLEAPLEPGGPTMLTVVRTTSAPSLIVAVSTDRDDLLAPWRRELASSIGLVAAMSFVIGGVLVVLFRQMDAKMAAEQALAAVQAAEQVHLREANERLAQALHRERVARADAESASALKDDFLMTISHELRTPLTAIYGWARILNQGGIDARQQGMALQSIERNAAAQTRLVNDLIDASGLVTGKLRLDVRVVDPRDVARDAVETVAPAADARGVRLDVTFPPEPLAVSADPHRLQQVVWNLLSNAVKFTPVGGSVRLSVARDGDEVVITVADDGMGISPAFLPHVFERFRQEHGQPNRQHGGLGVGLSIARGLVELHGGSIAAHSEGTGTGATFTVRLPVARGVVESERPNLAVAAER